MAKKKQSRDMQGIVVGTVLLLVLALGVFGVVSQFSHKDTTQEKVYTIDYTGQPVLGNKNATVKIMEFGDFKCPICKQFHDTVFPQLQKDFINTGKVAFYFTGPQIIGPDSITAEEAGKSIYKQNPAAFWKYYDTIYKNQGDENKEWATPTFLVNLIQKNLPEVNAKQVEQDLSNKTYEQAAKADNSKFDSLGINGVPAIFVNGKYISNGLSYADIKAAIEKELQKK